VHYILTKETTFRGGEKRERKTTGLSSQALRECQSELMALGTASRNLRIILDFNIFLCISGKCFLFLFCPHPNVQVDVSLLLIWREAHEPR